ncbi:MAG: peroxide stress protein YaaA [Acidimicrobiia bacterium]
MLILLPPSESKNPPKRRGAPVDLAALSFPELTPIRTKVLRAVIETSTRPDALPRLQVGPSIADEVRRNTLLQQVPARPALEIYSGVLFTALDTPSLSPTAKRRGAARLVIVSGLWGAIRPVDRIPPYRLHICSELVGLGSLEPLWRTMLPTVLAGAAGRRGVIVDCRSSSYQAVGMPEELGDRTVAIRVVRDDGRRSAASYAAKQTRGEATRYLLETGADPATPHDLVDVLADRWSVTLDPQKQPGKPWTANVVATG